MNILFLTQVVPYPLDAGPKVRSYHMLRYLAQRHAITLVSFVRNAQEARGLEHLRTFCHAVYAVPISRSRVRDAYYLLAGLIRREPFLIARDRVPAMHARIARLATENSFDWVHADQLGMAQYALALPNVSRLLDEHNAVWTIVRRMSQTARPGPFKWLMEIEWRQLQRYEARVCAAFDRVLTVSEEDRQALQSTTSNPLPITTLPICIDVETTPPVESRPQARDVLCVGGMFYPPNVDGVVWFADEVLPLVGRESPESKFWVVGARPDRRIVERADRDPHVRVTGYVAETTEFFRDSAVFAVPLRAGGGMRVKILDAWARGIPVVSTTIGCEGIEVRPGENILIADTAAEFAQAVLRVICDPVVRQRLAANGRRWVEGKYNWRVTYRELERVYAIN